MEKLKQKLVALDEAWDKSPSKKLIDRLYWLTISVLMTYWVLYFFVWK